MGKSVGVLKPFKDLDEVASYSTNMVERICTHC